MPEKSPRNDRDELAQELNHLREVFAGNRYGAEGSHDLLLPQEGRTLWPGSAVPVVARAFTQMPSGLIVPTAAASSPAPIDMMATYLTAEQLLGAPMPNEDIGKLITELPLKDILGAVGRLMALLRAKGASSPSTHIELVEQFCSDSTKARALGLVKEGGVFLAPQVLLAIAKLALLLHNPDRSTTSGDAIRNVILAELGLAAYLGGGDREGERHWGSLPASLALELVSNQHFNRSLHPGAAIAHFQSQWRDLPTQRNPELAAAHAAAFLEATGYTIEDAFRIGFMLWAHAANNEVGYYNPGHLDSILSEEELPAIGLFAADVDQMQDLVEKEVERVGFDWSANTFRRFPLIRHDDGSMTLLDPDFLLERACGTAAYWEINNQLGRAGKEAWGGFKSFRGMVVEDDVARSVAALAPGMSSGAKQFWTEQELMATWPGEQCCDFVLDFGRDIVCIEVVSHMLSEPSANALSIEALEEDLRMIVDEKAEQLHTTITHLLRDETALTGAPPFPGRRIFPVIIAAHGFPVNPITMTVIAERLETAGYLTHHSVADMQILDTEDLEAIESIHESGGPSLAEFLAQKALAGLRLCSMNQYLHKEAGFNLRSPKRLDPDRDAAFKLVLDLVAERTGCDIPPDTAAA